MTGGAVIYVKDLDAANAFYAQVAGLPVAQREASHALLGAAPAQLVIRHIPAQIAESIVIARPPQRSEDAPVKLVFLVPSIGGAHARRPRRPAAPSTAASGAGAFTTSTSAMGATPRAMSSSCEKSRPDPNRGGGRVAGRAAGR